MRTVQDLAFALTGQKIWIDAPEGRPLSVVSVEVFRWYSSDLLPLVGVVSSPAVEDDPDTNLDDAAGALQADPHLIPLADATGIARGRTYLLESSTGQRELVLVDAIDNLAVRATHPLHGNYDDSATFQSTRITADIADAWAAELANIYGSAGSSPIYRNSQLNNDSITGPNPMYRVRWVYTVGDSVLSREVVADTYFNLIRYPGHHGVTPQDVDNFASGWLNRLPLDHKPDQGMRLIDEAYRAVKLDLHELNLDDSAIAESEVMDELVRYKTVENTEFARYMAGSGDAQKLTIATDRYTKRLDGMIRLVNNTPVRNPDGAGAPSAPRALTVR